MNNLASNNSLPSNIGNSTNTINCNSTSTVNNCTNNFNSTTPNITDGGFYSPPERVILFFSDMVYGTLGAMAFLLLVVLCLQFVSSKHGILEFVRDVRGIFKYSEWYNGPNMQFRQRRNEDKIIVDDQGNIIRDDEEEEDIERETATDGCSMNANNNYSKQFLR
jgi:hypothetical protein